MHCPDVAREGRRKGDLSLVARTGVGGQEQRIAAEAPLNAFSAPPLVLVSISKQGSIQDMPPDSV